MLGNLFTRLYRNKALLHKGPTEKLSISDHFLERCGEFEFADATGMNHHKWGSQLRSPVDCDSRELRCAVTVGGTKGRELVAIRRVGLHFNGHGKEIMNARNGKLVFLPRGENALELRGSNAVADLNGIEAET